MNPGLIVQLATAFVPIVTEIIRRHQAAHPGELPTDEQILAAFTANIDRILADGAAWTAKHPKDP